MRTRGRRIGERYALALAAATLASVLLFAQTAASGTTVPDCRHGAISAVGPVDEQGNGQTTPEVRCIDP
jgi:hypothetical protein